MKYEPSSQDERFNEWYREFHLLFEDSYGSREEVMEIAAACYHSAREDVEAVPLLTSSYHADDLIGAVAEAMVALHDGRYTSIGLDFAQELSRRCNARFKKEMEA